MKSLLLFLSVFILAACGKVEVESSVNFSTPLSTTPEKYGVGSTEYKKLKEICDVLEEKEVTISGLVGNQYIFANTNKKCDDSGFSALPDSTVTLVSQGGQFKFQEGVNDFYFSNAETKSSGSMNQICANLTNLESPLRPDSVNLIYFKTSDISSDGCFENNGEICIEFVKAVVDTDSSGKQVGRPHTREWIRFKTIQPVLGFWNYRKLASIGGCLDGSYFGRTSELK